MPFLKGRTKTGGRPPGKQNRFTGLMKEAVQVAYNGLGGHAGFTAWAEANPTEFYKIAARLIPVEHRKDEEDRTINIIIERLEPQQQPVVNPPLPVAGALVDHSHDRGEGHAHG